MRKAALPGGGPAQEAARRACVEELVSPEEVAAPRVQQLHPGVGRVRLTPDRYGDTKHTVKRVATIPRDFSLWEFGFSHR